MTSGEPDKFWESVGGGATSREMSELAADSGQLLQFAASGILGNRRKIITRWERGVHSKKLSSEGV